MRKITIQERPGTVTVDHYECPFREFKDAEISSEYWGMGTTAFRSAPQRDKTAKATHDGFWIDEDVQPLPRSIWHYLDGWVRAEQLASERFEAEVVIFNDNEGGKILASNYVISYLQILQRSSFCRDVLCSCFILENNESITIEHQWDGFSFNFGSESWRPKFHIYCPGMKPGGGQQHRPVLSKNGCYLVRLFYLGCWRCVWVDDRIPVDASGAPLLPFSPLLPRARPAAPVKGKQPIVPTSKVILLWPVLLCKALLKLWAPDKKSDIREEDERMEDFNIIHALTGALSIDYNIERSELWDLFKREVQEFNWDGDSQTTYHVAKAKPAKKPTTKEPTLAKRASMTLILMADTKNEPIYRVPGITPNHEMNLMLTMIRDVPLQKPLAEPEIPLWKTYRWLDWAKSHGLYDAYEFSREKYLKCIGLLKMSYSPHMLDVTSTESIVVAKTVDMVKKTQKEEPSIAAPNSKEDLKNWIVYKSIVLFIKNVNVTYFPSMLNFVSTGSSCPIHINKVVTNKFIDIPAPKYAPVYLQIDSADPITMQIAFNVCHPRIMNNSGQAMTEYIPPGHLIMDKFEWNEDVPVPLPMVFLQTRGYENVEVKMGPGRHNLRLWVSSGLNWHFMMTSVANIILGSKELILSAAVKECIWSTGFLLKVSTAFSNWIRCNKSSQQMLQASREFYSSYLPDFPWDQEVIGYPRAWLHWMFQQALQSLLFKRLAESEYRAACAVLKKLFHNPDFGMIKKSVTSSSNAEAVEASVTLTEFDEFTDEIEKMNVVMKQIRASITIQSYWRRYAANKCFSLTAIPNDVQKNIMDVAFGNLDSLSLLWNEFFEMFPRAKSAYSVASALNGSYGLQQYPGITKVTAKCKWIPFFQTVFFCHKPVKVNFDLKGFLPRCTYMVYNNDTLKQVNSEFYTRLAQDFLPNVQGYTVLGYAILDKKPGLAYDAQWNFSVLCSSHHDFHICDSQNVNQCHELPLQLSSKLHIDEIFVPNKRNILGMINLAVRIFDCVSFRVETSMPELEIVANLQTINEAGDVQILDTRKGTGQLFWPFIMLSGPAGLQKTNNYSTATLSYMRNRSTRSLKSSTKSPKVSARTIRSNLKVDASHKNDIKYYTIEVSAPNGWPLTIDQWISVEERKNSIDVKSDGSQKKPLKDKPSSARDRVPSQQPILSDIRHGDPYTELEVSTTIGGGITAKRDDSREVAFAEARKSWDAKEAGRNMRGAFIRKTFREKYLEKCESLPGLSSIEMTFETTTRDGDYTYQKSIPHPTPVTESVLERNDKEVYLNLPEEMRDKFKPLDFLSECRLEETEAKTVLTPDIAEEAAFDREEHLKKSNGRMLELQEFNEIHILGKQKKRSFLLETLLVDSSLSQSLLEAFRQRATLVENQEKVKKK